MDEYTKKQISSAEGWGIICGFIFGGMAGMAILSVCLRFNSYIEISEWKVLLSFFIFVAVTIVFMILVHWRIINKKTNL